MIVNNPPPHVYADVALERASHLRKDEAFLRAALSDPRSGLVLLDGLRVLAEETGEGPRALTATPSELGNLPGDATPIFMGLDEGGRAWFALDVSERPLVSMGLDRGEYVELRSVSLALPPFEASLLATARGLMHWHLRHRFCGACGTETKVSEGGHVRRCLGCGLHTFPRTDPAVIVLVVKGERCLLGRSPRFPQGMHSTLAGFVEPGEGLEQCVRREVFEEVGVRLDEVSYRSSQPWPFPQSLMVGFRAEALTAELTLQPDEIESAAWFTRAELTTDPRPVRLPGKDSIARFLVDEWLHDGG